MHDAPTPDEFLKAIADLLRNEVMPAIEGEVAFQVRVAVNALDLVRRDITADPAEHAAWLDRCSALVGTAVSAAEADGALARGIASGAVPINQTLADHLLATTLAKLAVDQPRYAAGREAKLSRLLER